MLSFIRSLFFGYMFLMNSCLLYANELEEDLVASRERDHGMRQEERPTIYDLDKDNEVEQRALYGPRYYHCNPAPPPCIEGSPCFSPEVLGNP